MLAARAARVSRAAHGGILMLDEIGELPLQAQTRLLRVLQERAVTPVGSHRPEAVDFWLVSASHRDLAAMVASGTFVRISTTASAAGASSWRRCATGRPASGRRWFGGCWPRWILPCT